MLVRTAGLVLVLGGAIAMADTPLSYPKTKKVDVVDEYHGTKVADPYRWLEDDVRKSDEVKAWVEAQNQLTSAHLEAIPQRAAIRDMLTKLWNYERFSAPSKIGGKYFFSKNDGLQNQAVLYVQDSLEAEPRVLIDPNAWTKDGTAALGGLSISDDAKYAAYAVNDAGSDWQTWRVLTVADGKLLSDELKWCKFTGIEWSKDGKGFFYSHYPEPKPGETFQSLNLNQKLFYHVLGTPQSEDKVVYERTDHPDWGFSASIGEDGKYLVINTWKGTDNKYRVTVKDLTKPDSPPIELIDSFESEYSFIENDGPVLYFKTDLNAPRGRIIAIDLTKPEKTNWKELIPQAAETLTGVGVVADRFVLNYLKDARTQVKLFKLDGTFEREIELPGIGTAGGFGGKRTDEETFYTFSSFATPPSIYRTNLKTGETKLFRQSKVAFDSSKYEVKQVFYPSKDGTKIPMFLTMKKGTKYDGNNPVLLYGYGGFNISLTPAFSVARVAWLEMGGVFAQANLRGGGEYGEEWHQAGTKLNKQNVFDDFIGAAEYLIREKITQPKKLAIQGGSNGGLLVGACMTQRPDLYGACLPAVGVMDMLRFQKFTAGRFWVDDYGSSDNAEQFPALFKYSPYHNLKPGTNYPPTLVTTADTDDRVVPGHSFKFTARLQECQAGPAPVLTRIETRAGHGAGKPTAKLIEEAADLWAFLAKHLDMK
ncbi:prolyl oligopeptidase family serine peptidase [Tuwongella immobilis]|uniref:prolyl oligopeptidase n=1 Tax=Tuwongella immobilis TaxID=692036 RepID=A0A6C2YV40_9BACT|nr:prolyl oligopeptidase family serine peptidase [Tuwongella immobilis]VIP05480.1 prolyl endopeptidase : Prolyl oligopeptidase OS=Planctomyces brasiliensis (strain ATCC 49424 / DSM 5305 / JCM 21570 / NBRC 103401 / IFAM 1448) GN=Plabr_0450 PE=4 SV=1: Peptidase_S9_N: Peptidase_S9 [Tuwongella immobilis]VTS08316.1 prolyl endopeptidase : Prolyl oligopeptidase OS=Planctomyces brasiliensis (strain ATCC 49424 / DSM 5305 / JCM 21570 / NBRC 103401 / IFAM 1448) GN=Plabr_0450 PE=4 SV=1: Peptidase_S9_N: Pepti